MRWLLLLGLLVLPAPALGDGGPTGLQSGVVFSEYSAFSRDAELLRRSARPLALRRAQKLAASSGTALREQDVDLTHESFTLYVPPDQPPHGYALMVFIPPWDQATMPHQWKSTLDRHGVIFVSANNSGNDASTVERREPLALIAAQNVIDRYPVDPARVYIAGFSGGARVALRLAVAYPDLFRGALLDAGSIPLSETIALPPADLFHRFQEGSRIVYLTGELDDFHRAADAYSQRSLRDWCVFDIEDQTMSATWHALADGLSVNQALDALFTHRDIDPKQRDDCRAGVAAEMDAQLRRVEDSISAGKIADARSLLDQVDARYGGLAAARTEPLADRLDAGH